MIARTAALRTMPCPPATKAEPMYRFDQATVLGLADREE